VFFSWFYPEILTFSAHLFSFPSTFFNFSYSFKLWSFLEYWNNRCLGCWFEILCKIILSLYWMDIDKSESFGLLYFCIHLCIQLTVVLYHILFELTGSNIFLWIKENHWYFYLILSGICCFAASSIVSDRGLFRKLTSVEVVCSKFQRSHISHELISPAHIESSVTPSSKFAPARDSVVNLHYRLADHLFRGFHSAADQFQARRLKWLKIFSLCEK